MEMCEELGHAHEVMLILLAMASLQSICESSYRMCNILILKKHCRDKGISQYIKG